MNQKTLSEEKSSQAHGGRNKFSKTLEFHLRAWTLSLPTNTLSCFPRCDRLTLFISKKMSAKYPSLANIVICQLSFWVNMVFYVKGASSAFWTPTTTQRSAFPPDHLYRTADCLMHASYFVTEKGTQKLRFSKINNVYCCVRDILKWTWLFSVFRLQLSDSREYNAYWYSSVTALVQARAPTILAIILLLHHQCKWQHSEKGK